MCTSRVSIKLLWCLLNVIFFIQTNVCISLLFSMTSLFHEAIVNMPFWKFLTGFIMHGIHLLEEYEFREAWISSSVRPLVSGTSFATNSTVKPHMPENMKKVPAQTYIYKFYSIYKIRTHYVFIFLHYFLKTFSQLFFFLFLPSGSKLNDNIPAELQLMRKLKAYDIIQEHNQLTKVTRLPAEPFTLMGNIWKIKYNTR